jgi:hypothetical protein
MIIVHSAPARHVAHHLAALPAGQVIENEQLFEVYTTTGSGAAWGGTGPTARPPRPGRLAQPRPARLSRPPHPHRPPCRPQSALIVPAASLRLGRPRLSHTALPHPAGRTGTPGGLHVPAPLMLSRLRAGRGSDRPSAPAVLEPRPVAHDPRRPGGYSQARLPAAAAGAGRAPPVTAAAPPHELLEAQDRLYPWASHSPPLPRADQPT